MATSYPGGLDDFSTLTDNISAMVASTPNNLGDAIEQLQIKLGVDSSAVITTIDYFLKHTSGAYRTHQHNGSSADGAKLDWDNCWTDAVHDHSSVGEGSTVAIAGGGTGATTAQAGLNALAGAVTANRVLRGNGTNITLSEVVLTTDVSGTLPVGNGGTGATAAANTANGVVVLDANSKISAPQLGAWVDKSSSFGAQQAATDGFVEVYLVRAGGDSVNTSIGYTDAAANPTTIRTKTSAVGSSSTHVNFDGGFCMPVKKNDYWKVVNSGGTQTVYWIPLGS